jgi:hypothetical protein
MCHQRPRSTSDFAAQFSAGVAGHVPELRWFMVTAGTRADRGGQLSGGTSGGCWRWVP